MMKHTVRKAMPNVKLLFAFVALSLQSIYAIPLSLEKNNVFVHETKPEDNIKVYNGSAETISCHVCKIVMWIIQHTFHQKEDEFVSVVDKVCKALHVEASDVCDGIVKLFKEEVITVIDGLFLDPGEVCGFLVGSKCADFYDPFRMWNISLPDAPRYSNKPNTSYHSRGPTLRVLHLADVHIDPKYQVGSRIDCDKPLCCRNTSGPNTNTAEKAGQWGSYGHCDLPAPTLEHLFAYLSQNDKFDYIIWTGDLISHDDWDQTREEQLHLVDYFADMFMTYFPDTPVYWSLGNHESVPVNSFPPTYITGEESMSWLYPHLAKLWSNWLPSSTSADITRGGFYTVKLQTGYRLVSLNMNYCNSQNWWMLLNTTDPTGELEWLVSVLYKAELANEKVHIIGHIAPGLDDCMKAWSWNYYKIINRFASTVTGQFFGHAHTDSFEIFYDVIHLKQPVSVAYLAPSVTTFIGMNPAYRVYTIDGFYKGSSWSVLDHETCIMNLTEANHFGKPEWTIEYKAKAAYNMTDLSPSSWHLLSETFLHDDGKIQDYYRYFYKSSPGFEHCNKECLKNLICNMRRGRSHDDSFCHHLGVDKNIYKHWLIKNVMC